MRTRGFGDPARAHRERVDAAIDEKYVFSRIAALHAVVQKPFRLLLAVRTHLFLEGDTRPVQVTGNEKSLLFGHGDLRDDVLLF